MENRAGNGEAAELLEGFVEEVAGIQVGGDENVSVAGDGGIWGFFRANARVHGGVELHFSVDKNALFAEKGNDFLSQSNKIVATAATESRKRKEGNTRFVSEEGFRGVVSLPDDVDELRLCRVFAGGHVGKEISLGGGVFRSGSLHDGEARKGRIIICHAEMIAAGENDIARRIIDSGNQGVGGAGFDKCAGFVEILGGEGFDRGRV